MKKCQCPTPLYKSKSEHIKQFNLDDNSEQYEPRKLQSLTIFFEKYIVVERENFLKGHLEISGTEKCFAPFVLNIKICSNSAPEIATGRSVAHHVQKRERKLSVTFAKNYQFEV